MSEDLHLDGKRFELVLHAFYYTYITFEWMTLLYRVFPAHIYISICVAFWGAIASLQSIANSFGILMFLRALLGIGEAAFGPGVPFYLSFFYRREELAFRNGLFISASPLASSFAGALAYAIQSAGPHMKIRPWRLIFLVEGLPSILVALWAWHWIPDSPATARWLTAHERRIAVLRLRRDIERRDSTTTSPKPRGIILKEALQALKDPKSWITALMFLSCNVAFSSMPIFMPTIIHSFGFTPLRSQLLTAPVYLTTFLSLLLTAHLSDKHSTRSLFLIPHALLAASGYLTLTFTGYYRIQNNLLNYLMLYPATIGFFSCITLIITWTVNNQDTESKRGVGIAVLQAVGQCGPLVGTSIFPDEEAEGFVRGMAVCAACMVAVAVLAVGLRVWLGRCNR
ncbi:MFS general substrate transporter, partial [Sporormia fimetaria CBS 119925]